MTDWIGVAARSAGPWVMGLGMMAAAVTTTTKWFKSNRQRRERDRRIADQDAARRERLKRR